MKISKVEFKNFSSYGNRISEVNFDNDGAFWLITGDNGTGKSSISDVIKFAIYGKLANKRVSDIPNRFNGAAWVRITMFSDTNNEIVIERGISPTFLKVWVDDMEYDAAHKKDTQEYIEDTLVQMPFYVFNNIISLSINDFKSFLSINAANKRLIFDRIFGLSILTQMKTEVRVMLKETKSDLDVLRGEYDVLIRTLETSNKEMIRLNDSLQKSLNKKTKGLESDLVKLDERILDMSSKMTLILEKKDELKTNEIEITKTVNEFRSSLKEIKKKEKLYENDKCPICESELTGDYHEHIQTETILNKKKYENEMPDLEKRLGDINTRKIKVSDLQMKLTSGIASSKEKINTINRQLGEKDMTGITTEQTKSLNNIIDKTETQKYDVLKKQTRIKNKQNFLKILDEAFGDKGIKQIAIMKIIPSLNADIALVLKEMNIEYTLQFNKNFDVEIKHFGHDVATPMLSTGERKKLDLSIIIALIKVLKTRFNGLNLLFLDEIFSSIDASGRYHILYILSKLTEKLKINIFVINHTPLPTELFHHHIAVEKIDNFSRMNIEHLN